MPTLCKHALSKKSLNQGVLLSLNCKWSIGVMVEWVMKGEWALAFSGHYHWKNAVMPSAKPNIPTLHCSKTPEHAVEDRTTFL